MNQAQDALLKILASGEVCSGEMLGKSLGISRAAVWKHLQQLQAMGLPLQTLRGAGYRLESPLQLLDQRYLREQITPRFNICLSVEPSVDSTNQCLYDAFADSQVAPRPTVLFAEYQTQGRGRRGRAWHSPFGSNLYFSLAWPYSQGIKSVEGVSLAVGVAICRALQHLGVSGVGLKWPNDVLCGGKKLAGILVEVGGDVSGDCFIVVGIGLNVNMPRAAEIDQPWTDLKTLGGAKVWDRNQVALALLNELLPMLTTYAERGFDHYHGEWQHYHAYQNQAVTLMSGKHPIHGICLGVNRSGSLKLNVGGQERVFSGGELSLRAG